MPCDDRGEHLAVVGGSEGIRDTTDMGQRLGWGWGWGPQNMVLEN